MNYLRMLLPAVCMTAAANAGLKPVDADLVPADHKATIVYKSTAEGELKIDLYFPDDWKPSDRRPAIVYFFGGGFVGGTTAQFAHAAEYLARRGMVAASAEYRVRNRHQTGPEKSIEDAKSAIRWLRLNAGRLGIDPNRVAAGGGSAGATCAVFTAYNTVYEPAGEDTSVSQVPNALVLNNPALGFARDSTEHNPEQVKTLGPVISNWRVTKDGPPAIVFFGTADSLLEGGRAFVERMLAAGNRAELYTAAGQKHGFFNAPRAAENSRILGVAGWHDEVVYHTDLFLTSLGYLKGKPTVHRPSGIELKKELP